MKKWRVALTEHPSRISFSRRRSEAEARLQLHCAAAEGTVGDTEDPASGDSVPSGATDPTLVLMSESLILVFIEQVVGVNPNVDIRVFTRILLLGRPKALARLASRSL